MYRQASHRQASRLATPPSPQLAFAFEGDDGPRHGRGHLDSPKNIARLNIEHYRRLLATENDPTKREMIEKLLSEEETKLRALEAERKPG